MTFKQSFTKYTTFPQLIFVWMKISIMFLRAQVESYTPKDTHYSSNLR